MSPHFISPKMLGILTSLVLLLGIPSTWAFSIIEPKPSSVHQAGQHIPVTLELGNVPGVTKVAYYWYREDEDMLQELAEDRLALVSTAKHTPPFGGNILVPKEAIGAYRLLAVAEQGGRQSQVELLAIFDEVLLHIEPKAQLVAIDFQTEKPLRLGGARPSRVYAHLDFLGTTLELPVVGQFSDGITRAIHHHTAGTTYHSANEQIITVTQDGVLRVVGNGKTGLMVKNRDQEATLDILVEVDETPNDPPVCNSGKELRASAGKRITLNGLGSYDPEGGSLQYHWSQVRGSKIPLLDPYSAQARFLAPLVTAERTFRFKLRVTDVQGANSHPSYVDVIIEP